MLRSIAYLAAFATAIFTQSSDAGVVTMPVEKVKGRNLLNSLQQMAPPIMESRRSSGSGNIKLKYSDNQSVFIGDMQIGTPPQTFKVLFGTGSMVIWAPNYKVGKHAYYNSSASSTYVKNGTYYQVQYGDNLVTGFVSVDTIRFGGITFSKQQIMEASNTTGMAGYADGMWDGIFGLGLDVENPYMLPNPLQKLAMEGKLDKPQFAFYFGKTHPEITLGGVNPSHFKGDINYVPVQSTGAWWIQIDSTYAGNTTVTKDPTYTRVDTGTSGIYAGTAEFPTLVAAVGAKQTSDGDYSINCGSTGPTVTIVIGGKPYTFEKADYTTYDKHGKCFFAIGDSGDEYWLLGNTFLGKYYTVFDFGTNTTDPRVGFALASSDGDLPPQSDSTTKSGCSLKDGVDYTGRDVGNKPAPRAEDCFGICGNFSGCGAFTWTGYNGGTCWLKAEKGSTKPSSGARSGVPCKCDSTVTIEEGIDYIGNDIGNVYGANADACVPACSSKAGCGAFTWTDFNGGTCWLKSAKGLTQSKSGARSGVVGNGLEVGVDYVGNDIGSAYGAKAQACIPACQKQAGCHAFSWTKFNGGTCFLKSAKGATVRKDGVISGVVC